jgi:DUF4097 and DUF4098 domain-containing protein YvlB
VSRGKRSGSSVFAGLLLVLIGVLFLIAIYYPQIRLGHLIALYWPALLIFWGVAKIFDYLLAQRRGEPRPAVLSGGEAVLIVVLAIALGGFVVRDWVRDRVPHWNFEMPEFGPSYSRSEQLPPQTIPQGSQLAIDIPRGNIEVQARAGNQLVVSALKTTWGMSKASAQQAMQGASVKIENSNGFYRIGPQFASGGRDRANFDLSIQAPASASVAASTRHGDVRIHGIAGNAQAHSGGGDIDVRDVGGNVAVNLTRGDARIAGVAGNLRVTGGGGDLNISDVNGDASVEGPFYGTIRATHVAKTLRCAVPWSQISVAQLNGSLKTDLGDLSVSGASGPLKISTHNSDVDVKNAAGQIDIADAHGDIKVALATPPRANINITNVAGDVDVTLPRESSFEVEAVSRGGDAESDFDQLNVSNMNANGQITGLVGTSGGPRITIATTYGTIHLRKSSE